MRYVNYLIILGLVLSTTMSWAQNKGGKMTIKEGKEVSIHYELTVDGQVVDSSKGKEPLTYQQGKGQIIPGLSKSLEGLNAGDKKNVSIAPEEAYGNINPKAFQEIPRSQLPENIEPKPGMNLQATTPDGKMQILRISEVKDEVIVVDLNHPLAGKTLNFNVEIVDVK